jgi:polar amino acid transport system permease protein
MIQSKSRNALFHPGRRSMMAADIVSAAIISSLLLLFIYRALVVLNYHWNWSILASALFSPKGILLKGFIVTIRLSIWSTIVALIVGTVVGMMRITKSHFPRLLSLSYVSLLRNLPPLVLVFLFYFFFSTQVLDPLGLDRAARAASPFTKKLISTLLAEPGSITAFISAILTLGLYEASYIAEIVRSGIRSVPKEQWEAAWALGLSPFERMKSIVLPQAFRNALPAMAGQFISTIKDSAIVSVISIGELTFQGMELTAATYRTFEIWISVSMLYFLLTFTLSRFAALLERKMRKTYAD